MKKQLSLSLFLYLSHISLGQYSQRNGWGVEKKSYIKEWTYGDDCPRMKDIWNIPELYLKKDPETILGIRKRATIVEKIKLPIISNLKILLTTERRLTWLKFLPTELCPAFF